MLEKILFKIGIFIGCCFFVAVFFSEASVDLHNKRNKDGVIYWHGDVGARKIALTFDDGPNEPYTFQILNILKAYNIKATFFLIGKNVESYPEIVKRIAKEGHSIGNHTYSHPDLMLRMKFQIEKQIKSCEEAIVKTAGVRPYLFRPPYGLDNHLVFRETEKMGYIIIKWSVSAHNGSKDARYDKMLKRVLKGVGNGSIILLHDGDRLIKEADRSQIVKALPLIIKLLQQKGYQFVTIPELLGFEKYS
ncbi:MAG: polysaccharide deacetylase family protein [Candidatus Omnitrophica bacterium]|nr:polysaccharide deacetylase family protein [Candidatus Omnitrophota bacterium]